MAKIFYDHLIIIEEVVMVLDQFQLTPEDKKKFLHLLDETLHPTILNTILTHLPKTHHEAFLKKFINEPYNTTLIDFLQERTTVDIEKEILKAANMVKKKSIKDIKEAAEG